MTDITTSLTRPTPCGLPPLSGPLPLTDDQWHVLMSVMDTALPSVQRNVSDKLDVVHLTDIEYDGAIGHLRQTTALDLSNTTDFDSYLAERPSELPLFQDVLKRVIAGFPEDKLASIRMILSMMNNRVTTFPLTGYFTPFPDLSIHDRTLVLHSWRTSSLPSLRLLFKQFTVIARHIYVRTSSLLSNVSGFPSVPREWSPSRTYPFEFMQFHGSDSPIQLNTDVIVVGSGCGAGVVARSVANAGHKVIVVDKGFHFPASSMPLSQEEAFFHLFEQGGLIASEDGSTTVMAGSCFGGGGTVNWSASLQTQSMVRDEWAGKLGLKFFNSAEFQACLDRVSDHMGVSDKFIRQNHGNSLLLNGGRKLGFSAKAVPQNTGGCEHADGYCGLGCWKGEKQGPVNGWFPDAAKRGAKFIEGFKVEKVLFSNKKGKRVADGVVGTWSSRNTDGTVGGPANGRVSQRVVIKAKKVVISAGSLWSPVILQKSGLKNKQIGRNLRLHPTTFVSGFFKEDVRPWEGGILTSVISSFEDLDGKGHGVKLERASMVPSVCSIFLNWTSGFDFKILLSKYRHMESLIAIVRDRDSGFVSTDPVSGGPRITYTPSAFDRHHNMVGMVALAKVLYIQGAVEIHPSLPGLRPFIRSEADLSTASQVADPSEALVPEAGITDETFQAWLKEMELHGNKVPDTPFGSAHQMSSCRMSSSERDGVVDERGKVWGCEGLYVADASVLPSASGVNPMVTIMAICDWISSGVVRELGTEGTEVAKM